MYHLLKDNTDEARKLRLHEWLTRMKITPNLNIDSLSEDIFSVILTDPVTKLPVNMADVGIGTSQVLPVIVQSIWAHEQSLILLEQPEIHLHPKLQGDLADFFIDMKNEGKQFLIETHSEHLLLRFQRRIAERKLSYEDIAIYYFEMKEEGTDITEIKLDVNGTLKKMPKGFFEEDLDDSSKMLEALGEEENAS